MRIVAPAGCVTPQGTIPDEDKQRQPPVPPMPCGQTRHRNPGLDNDHQRTTTTHAARTLKCDVLVGATTCTLRGWFGLALLFTFAMAVRAPVTSPWHHSDMNLVDSSAWAMRDSMSGASCAMLLNLTYTPTTSSVRAFRNVNVSLEFFSGCASRSTHNTTQQV